MAFGESATEVSDKDIKKEEVRIAFVLEEFLISNWEEDGGN